jgi:hypothetical protein
MKESFSLETLEYVNRSNRIYEYLHVFIRCSLVIAVAKHGLEDRRSIPSRSSVPFCITTRMSNIKRSQPAGH